MHIKKPTFCRFHSNIVYYGYLGALIRCHRKKSNLTQKKLADLAGVGKTAVFDIEHGKETVQFDTLQKVCAVLNISIRLD